MGRGVSTPTNHILKQKQIIYKFRIIKRIRFGESFKNLP